MSVDQENIIKSNDTVAGEPEMKKIRPTEEEESQPPVEISHEQVQDDQDIIQSPACQSTDNQQSQGEEHEAASPTIEGLSPSESNAATPEEEGSAEPVMNTESEETSITS